MNRVIQKQSSDSATPVFTYVYDTCGKGRLCYIHRDGSFSLYFSYDAQGRQSYQLSATTDGNWTYSLYAYDSGGRLSQVTYPTGRTVNYSYDAFGRVNQVSTTLGTVTTVLANSFQYPPFSTQATSMTFGNGMYIWRSRDQDYQPKYDFNGPRYKYFNRQEDGNINIIHDIYGTQENLSYDAAGRLTGAADTDPASFGARAYTYDKNGNRQSETANGVTASYGYLGGTNRLFTVGPSAYYVADGAGNYTFITGVGSLSYDGYGRLVTAPNTSYEYNALGQRIRKTVNGANTYFHYDPEGKLLFEQDPAGNKLQYVYVNGQLLARIDNSTIYYYHTDQLGTPQAMTDASGAVVWQENYDPFGKAMLKVQTVTNNIRFPGQYADQETGLNYNYFRYYDSGTGRYVQSDPIGLDGGSFSTYAYVGGNPLRWIDPMGLAIGDFPPAPPNSNSNWPTGQFPNGKWWTQSPNGDRWVVHPEDPGHWRHWDIQDPNGKDKGSWPKNPDKPWPGQKGKLKPNQCPADPSGDAPQWTPPNPDPTPDDPTPPDTIPFVPLVEPWAIPTVPIRVPIFVPAF